MNKKSVLFNALSDYIRKFYKGNAPKCADRIISDHVNIYMQKYGDMPLRADSNEIKLLTKKIKDAISNFEYNTKTRQITETNQVDDGDIHEMQKKIMDNEIIKENSIMTISERNERKKETTNLYVDGIMNIRDKRGLQDVVNPYMNHVKYYLVFDSFNRNIATSSSTKYSWDYQATANLQTGSLNTIYPISNLIKIKINSFQFPFFYDTITPVVTTGLATPYLNYPLFPEGRLSIFFEELQSQSLIYSPTRRFHIMMRVVRSNYNLYFYECQSIDYNDGSYTFEQPITTFSSLTISLGSPGNVISMPTDRSLCTFGYGNPTTITTTLNPNRQLVNYYVVFKDFTTDDTNADSSVINAMNNPNGIVINSVVGADVFTINIDTSSITPKADLEIMCYFGNFRYLFTAEFICIKDVTN